MVKQIKYPIIALKNPATITVYKDEGELTKCFKRALTNGYFKNLHLIDSNGVFFKVINATKIGTIGGLWGYDIFLDQTIRVKLEFDQKTELLTLDDFKNKIIKTIDRDIFFWSSGGNLPEIKSTIRDCTSFDDVINKIDDLVNKKHA